MADYFAEAAKKRRPSVVNERSLQPDPQRWWKIANNVTDKFGTAVPTTKRFQPVPLATVFAGTNKGIICNVELKFFNKARTDDLKPLGPSDTQDIGVELIRAYIVSVDVDVQLPTKALRIKQDVKPTYNTADHASDDVMKRLKDLGI